jgi:hypothetical protein
MNRGTEGATFRKDFLSESRRDSLLSLLQRSAAYLD